MDEKIEVDKCSASIEGRDVSSVEVLSLSPLSISCKLNDEIFLIEETPLFKPQNFGEVFLYPKMPATAFLDDKKVSMLAMPMPKGQISAEASIESLPDIICQTACALFSLESKGYCHTKLAPSSAYFYDGKLRIGLTSAIKLMKGEKGQAYNCFADFIENIYKLSDASMPEQISEAVASLRAVESFGKAALLIAECFGQENFPSRYQPTKGGISLSDLKELNINGKTKHFFLAKDDQGKGYFLKESKKGSEPVTDSFIGAYSPYLAEIHEKRKLLNIFGGEPMQAYVLPRYQLTLSEAVHAGSLSIEDKAGLFLGLLLAIRDLAAMGKVHRDIKPSNIFAFRDSKGRMRSVLGDFDTVVGCGEYVNSLGYTPNFSHPAIQSGSAQVSVLFDIYSAGVILYYIFQGAPLFNIKNNSQEDLYSFPPSRQKLRDSKLQDMVEKSIQPINKQKRLGWGFDFIETREEPMKAVDAFISSFLSYLAEQNNPKLLPSALAPTETAFYALPASEAITVEYEVIEHRGELKTSFKRYVFLREGEVQGIEYSYSSKDGWLRKLNNSDSYPPRAAARYRERIVLFCFMRSASHIRYLVIDENYVSGIQEPEGELSVGTCFTIEDEVSDIKTTYIVTRVIS